METFYRTYRKIEAQDLSTRAEFIELFWAIQRLTVVVGQNKANRCQHPTLEYWLVERSISHNIVEFRKLNPPHFKGGPDPLIVEAWILQIKELFSVLDLTKEKKVPLVAFMLISEVEHWWRLKKDVFTWKVFTDAFFNNFFPTYIRGKKEEEF